MKFSSWRISQLLLPIICVAFLLPALRAQMQRGEAAEKPGASETVQEGSIEGRVISAATGDPLPGITVGLLGSYQPPPVKTDAKGHFRFDGIKVRAIGVTIWPDSGYIGQRLIISLENKRDVTGIELKAYKPAVVSGRVKDA